MEKTLKALCRFIFSSILLFGCTSQKTPTLGQMADMTDEECLTVLEKLGFQDTGAYETREETAEAAKVIIQYYADGGSADSVPFSYTGMIEMAEEIQSVLKLHGY